MRALTSLLLALAAAQWAAAGEPKCALEITLRPAPSSPIRLAASGNVAVQLPEKSAKELLRTGHVSDLQPSSPGWRPGPSTEKGRWVYFAWRTTEKRIPHAETPPIVLGGLRPGHYRVDFMPQQPTTAAQYVWLLPTPVECEVAERTKVRLELQAKRPSLVRATIRSGADKGGASGEKRGIYCYDVTAGHSCRVAKVAPDEEGRVSLLLLPARTYAFRTRLGRGGSSRVVDSQSFTADEYRERTFEWTLAGDLVATWRVHLVVREGGKKTPFRQDAQLHIQGKTLSTTMGVEKGQRVLSVFKGGEEGMTYLVAGNRYALKLSDPTGRDYCILGPNTFEVPKTIKGEGAFEVLLGRRRKLRLECVDAPTGRALPAFTMAFRSTKEGGPAYEFRTPPPPHSLPLSVAPGTYAVAVSAPRHRSELLRVEVEPATTPKLVKAVLPLLDQLRVTIHAPEDERPHLHVMVEYQDRRGRAEHMQVLDDTVVFEYDDRRPAVLSVRHEHATEYAAQVIPLKPGQRQVAVELTRGILFEADLRVGGRPFSEERPGFLAFVAPGPPRLLGGRAFPRKDGTVAVRLMPGEYAVYLVAQEAGRVAFHLDDIKVDRDSKRAYEFPSFKELEGKKTDDPLKRPLP